MTTSSTQPTLTGIHHVKIPVADLEATGNWYRTVLGARRETRFDHRDQDGRLFAIMLFLPGCAVPVELRHAPDAAAALAGFDPVTFGVANEASLTDWVGRLDSHGVTHTPVTRAFVGSMVEFTPPDGPPVRLYTDPPGGFAAVELDPTAAPPGGA
ncbi:MAG TPA: VOC family protein [Pseudonocardiaceae bacterium]|jgi:catechol 2,3-dioxygenase-like lactoylglutathione lyase family enzyme|nr:VOC family protein [Pseudonocardiaceae bacterium]